MRLNCSVLAVNFSHCFSGPLRQLCEKRGTPCAPTAQSQRVCYPEEWQCPYTTLAQFSRSGVLGGRLISLLRAVPGGSAPCKRHPGFPNRSALTLAFTLWRSCQPLCKSRIWMRQGIFFWQTGLVFQAGLMDMALISFPWPCLGWRKTSSISLSMSSARGLSVKRLAAQGAFTHCLVLCKSPKDFLCAVSVWRESVPHVVLFSEVEFDMPS